MREPLATMARGDSKAGPPSDSPERDGSTRSVSTDLLFLKGPAQLDGIEVVRVRRKVHNADAVLGAERHDPAIVVRCEVVEDNDVTGREPWQELLLEPVDEALLVGCPKHGGEHHP